MYLKELLQQLHFLLQEDLLFVVNGILVSQNNGYLGCFEQISEFDRFFAVHIENCGNCAEGSTLYLTANIYNELINILDSRF